MKPSAKYRFTVCICTRNRPDDLSNAIRSVYASEYPVAQVVVSDDSSDGRTEELVRKFFPNVHYVHGPRKGLGCNRNCAASRAVGTHVLFIDDDAEITPGFFSIVAAEYDRFPAETATRHVVSGLERIHGRVIFPSDLGFLGFLDRPRGRNSRDPLHTSVINATIFPIEVFRTMGFDENLIYGSDESDFSTRCTSAGYTIHLIPSAINEHHQSPIHRDDYASFRHGSRLYVTFKLYCFVRRQPLKALVYVPYACLHLIAHAMKKEGLLGLWMASRAIHTASSYLIRYLKSKTDRAPLVVQ